MPSGQTCKLCFAKGKKFARAHIIPRSLYGSALHHPKGPAKIISDLFGGFSRRTPTGIYDKNLVCVDCESKFSQWDHYVHKLLLKTKPDQIRELHGKRKAYVYTDVNYSLLKLFFISLLWRANASEHGFFANVELGHKLEKRARNMLLDSNPGSPHEFAVVLARFDDDLANAILNPFHERYDGVGVYRFSFSQHAAYIKVTTKNFTETFGRFILRPESPLVLLARDYRKGGEFRAMVDMIQNLDD